MKLDKERVLVTGAGGWFGREFLSLHPHHDVMCVGSHEREIEVDAAKYPVYAYDLKAIRDYAPTVVVDCAGLNRHRAYKMTFLSECLDLTLAYLHVMSLPSVKAGLTFSSGAAAYDPVGGEFEDYAASKVLHERLVRESRAPSVIMRCYAVTGRHCQERGGYAATAFVDMARQGTIKVEAKRPTFRRYMAIDDYLRVGLTQLGKRVTLDSSGWWVEMGGLAAIVAEQTGAKVRRPKVTGAPTQYGSSDQYVLRLARDNGIRVKDMHEQIAALL